MRGGGYADVLPVLQVPDNKADAVPRERLPLFSTAPSLVTFRISGYSLSTSGAKRAGSAFGGIRSWRSCCVTVAQNRHIRQRKKREEKRKARRLRHEQAAQAGLFEELLDEAEWLLEKDPARAVRLLQKAVRLRPDDDTAQKMLAEAAEQAGNKEVLYEVVLSRWEARKPCHPRLFILLAEMALARGRPALGLQVGEGLLDALRTYSVQGKRALQARCRELIRRGRKDLLAATDSAATPRLRAPSRSGSKTPPLSKAVPAPDKSPLPAPSAPAPSASPAHPNACTTPFPHLECDFSLDGEDFLSVIASQRRSTYADFDLALAGYRVSFRTSYDQLVCLPTLRGVRSLWYQEETARKVLKTFRGRALLADEVGLGKTIEACLVLKEYILRGLVHSALILTPTSLVSQWQEELAQKFDLHFASTNDMLFKKEPAALWERPFIVASMHTAKRPPHNQQVTSRAFDLVIVDEAHHLKNRTTLNWKLVNALRKTFILLLTATPIQNRLEELYNLVTLLKPGQLKTLKAFKAEFVTRGNPTDPRNRSRLRGLLQEVMLRNTRSVTGLHLPPREAWTIRVSPQIEEALLYQGITDLISRTAEKEGAGRSRLALRTLLEAAGSSPPALLRVLKNLCTAGQFNGEASCLEALAGQAAAPGLGAKAAQLLQLLSAIRDPAIVFVRFRATLEHLAQALAIGGIKSSLFHGNLSPAEKDEAIERFRQEGRVLLTTESGGEGRNLQFCHVMVNFDLPWNPMQIEQRIGRIHRIGQEQAVQIYNFCAAGSIEDRILDILDRKINLFELVIGEIDMILGHMKGEQEFADRVYEIWVGNRGPEERDRAFAELEREILRARTGYRKSKELDEKLFREDFGV
jgi:superfamily II DNA or RNA helicase